MPDRKQGMDSHPSGTPGGAYSALEIVSHPARATFGAHQPVVPFRVIRVKLFDRAGMAALAAFAIFHVYTCLYIG